MAKTRHNVNLKEFFKPKEGLKSNTGYSLERSSEAFFNDFVVDTSSVKFIEGPVSHSYTFALTANYDNPTLVQNLLLAKHDNMDSNTDFMKINVSKIKLLFKDSKLRTSTFLWKGHWLAKAKFKNKNEIYLKISNYGNVFYDLENKRLCEMPINGVEVIFDNQIID